MTCVDGVDLVRYLPRGFDRGIPDRKPGDAIDAIARTPSSYLGVHRIALDRVAAAHLDGLGDGLVCR